MPRLLLAAGGTGGHMFPAQALAEILINQYWDVALMTDSRGQTHAGRIPADPVIEVKAASFGLRNPLAAFKGVMLLFKGTRQAVKFMKDWRPDIVVGFGGYPAFPAMKAAQSLNIPTIIHEQNAVLGRVNRVFAPKAQYVVSGFERLGRMPRDANHLSLGNPLRQQILNAIPSGYTSPKDQINLLIVGGSLGARLISETVPKAIQSLPEALRKRLKIVQQTRAESLESAKAVYEACGVDAVCQVFFDNIETHLADAHYVIGRAGASTVSEIAAMGKPALFVPLAIAMEDHQTENALTLKSLSAADILPESEFTPEIVKSILETRLNDSNWLECAAKAARHVARPEAASDLAALVVSTSQTSKKGLHDTV